MPKTGLIGVPFNSDFEEIKKSIILMAQKDGARTSYINAFLLEKHNMDELLKYARDLTERYGPNAYFNNANSFKGHFQYLRQHGWTINEDDGYYQIVGFKGSKSTGQSSSVQVEALNRGQNVYLPTKEDCEQAIEKLKYIKTTSSISENMVLSFLESYLKDKYHLQNNWQEITRSNFKKWFSIL